MQRSHTAPLLVFWKVLFQRWLRASWLLMGKCEHSDNKGDKWTVERLGPEDARVSRGGGGNPGGEGPKGGAGSGLGHLGEHGGRCGVLSQGVTQQAGLCWDRQVWWQCLGQAERVGRKARLRTEPPRGGLGLRKLPSGPCMGRSFLAHQARRGAGGAPAGPALTEKSRGGRFTFLTLGDKRSYKNCRQVCLKSW